MHFLSFPFPRLMLTHRLASLWVCATLHVLPVHATRAQSTTTPATTAARSRLDAPACTPTSTTTGMRASRESWTTWGGNVRNTRAGTPATRAASDSLVLRWALWLGEVSNARSQATVLDGRVYVTSEGGSVWALDAERGCQWWRTAVGAPVRTSAVLLSDNSGAAQLLYVGDAMGRVLALQASTGAIVWTARVDAHPMAIVTGTPQLHRGVLYVGVSSYESAMPLQPKFACCTFRGSVVALDARTGLQKWKTYTIDETPSPNGKSKSGADVIGPSGAAVWSTPTIDEQRGRLYVGTGNNYSAPQSARSDAVMALDLATGTVAWSRQFTSRDGYNVSCDVPGKYNCPEADGPDADIGQPPILVDLPGGGHSLLVGAKSGILRALDPDREGATRWEYQVGPGGKLGGLHWGSATDGRLVFAAYGGQLISAVADSTAPGGMRLVADASAGGGLVALDVRTGALQWRAPAPVCDKRPGCSPAQSAAVTVAHGIVWSGALDGHLRGYDARSGRIVWDQDMVRDYQTVNGSGGRGGSLDVGGPVIVGNSLYVGAGYGLYGAMPGNVFLAFTRVARGGSAGSAAR
jgi:polyvinyl alcohol dehydrogenase (cytochrome)